MNAIITTLFASVLISTQTIDAAIFAPYIDVTNDKPIISDIAHKTGVKSFTLAFVLGGIKGECDATWGGQFALDDATIMARVNEIKALKGEIIVAFGGAVGPYLEMSCDTPQQLLQQYKRVLDHLGSTHMDIDIVGLFNFDIMNEALALLQRERPHVTIGFTLIVQSDNDGLNSLLGIEVLKNAIKHNVRVDIVNSLAMDFWSERQSWGEAVLAVGDTIAKQLKELWPHKSEADLYRMLGVTPMIGKNFNGKIFEPSHARQLVDWANRHQIAYLSFWSIGRDNNGCPGREIEYYCSSIEQSEYEFTNIFAKFNGSFINPTPRELPTLAPVTIQKTIIH